MEKIWGTEKKGKTGVKNFRSQVLQRNSENFWGLRKLVSRNFRGRGDSKMQKALTLVL